MSFPRYSEYKDSASGWARCVPNHWRIVALKRIIDMQSGESITSDEIRESGSYAVFGGNGLRGYTNSYTHDGTFVLIGRQGALCGNVNYASGRFWASEHAIVATPKERLDTMWLGEMLSAMNLNQYSISAAQPGLSVDAISKLQTVVPPIVEQTAIGRFLRHENAKIDGLIAEQGRLIELLQEKRQGVISQAVTRGLDPNAPMRHSGVEWLGDVPAHWTPRRLKALFKQSKRQGFPEKDVLSVYREFGVVRKNSRDDNFNKTPEDVSSYQLVECGDLVVNKMKAWQGSLGVSELEGITSPDYMVFIPLHEEDNRFLHLLLRSKALVSSYLRISNGIRLAQWRLEPDAFLAQTVWLPPIDEQRQIAAVVNRQTEEWGALVKEAQTAINLLQERRSAIVAAAVTGQIDVRGLVEQEAV